MTEQDVKPWYRQFWPWFLICLPGSAVIASLYTVSLAVRTTDSLVITSDDGMDVIAERHRAAEGLATELGLRARIDIDTNSGAIQATVTAGSAVDWPKTLVLLLSHPAFAARDQSITLTASRPDDAGNPSWTGHFVGVPEGRWYMVLADGDAWRLTGTWSGASTAELVPASAYGDAGR
ncbi:MAG: FixH family protein [Woeseiaceae bacterium]